MSPSTGRGVGRDGVATPARTLSRMTVIAGARDMGELVVLIPHLLGYHPEPGLVLVGLNGRRVGPVLRLEVPEGTDTPGVDPAMDPALRRLARHCEHALVVVFERWAGQSEPLERLVRAHAAAVFLDLDDTVRVLGGRWCRLVDAAGGVGGLWAGERVEEEGGPVPAESHVPGAAEFVVRGSAPLSSRDEIAVLLHRRTGDTAAVCALLGRARRRTLLTEAATPRSPRIPDPESALTAWRRVLAPAQIGETGGFTQTLPAHTVAAAVRALDDIELRDELFGWICPHLAADPDLLPARVRGLARRHLGPRTPDRDVQRALLLLVQHTPEPDRAPVLTALGLCSWGLGDGAMAREAVVAALEVRPGYTMAQLLLRAIQYAVRLSVPQSGDDADCRDEGDGTRGGVGDVGDAMAS